MEREEYLETVEKYVKGKIQPNELLSFGISAKSEIHAVFDESYFQQLFQDRVINFETIVNHFVLTDSLEMLIENVEFFDFLFEREYCDLRGVAVLLYHLSTSERATELLTLLAQNSTIVKHLLTEEFISFEKLVDLFANVKTLDKLITAMTSLNYKIDDDKKLMHVAKIVDNEIALQAIVKDADLLSKCLNSAEIMKKFDEIIQNDAYLKKSLGADASFRKYVEQESEQSS